MSRLVQAAHLGAASTAIIAARLVHDVVKTLVILQVVRCYRDD